MEVVKKTLFLSSSPSSIANLEDYIQDIIHEVSICESKYPEILISLTEAVNNAIIHGNKSDESKQVQINCKCNGEVINFSIKDEGQGFDPGIIPDPTSQDRIECCGGRGVFIINSLADKVAYKNNGNTLEIFFNLS
jgi:serine/threonine-protein kinase RsbW